MMKNYKKKMFRKLKYMFLIFVLFFSQSSLISTVYALSSNINYETSTTADPDTSNIESLISGKESDDGKVVTDKTVIKTSKENEFEIILSALGQSYQTSKIIGNDLPIDVVFVIDASLSMYQYGSTRYLSLVKALNSAMRTISTANPDNRMGIVTFNGDSDVLLELGNYKTIRTKKNNNDDVNVDSFIRATSTSSTKTFSIATEYIRTKENKTINKKSVVIQDGTYTQIGVAEGAKMLLSASNKQNRVPVMILLSDGMPTYYSQNIENPTFANREGLGRIAETTSTMGVNTILTAVKFKNDVTKKYMEVNNNDKKFQTKFYTIALDLDATNKFEQAVLEPSTSKVNSLGNEGLEGDLKRDLSQLSNYNYVDKGYEGLMTDRDLIEIFNEIALDLINEIVPPLNIVSNSVDDKYLTFTDTLGVGMEVKEAPVVNYNGVSYTPTTSNKNDNYTEYYYDYDVTTSSGKKISLNDLMVKIYTKDEKIQEIVFKIPNNLLPYIIRNHDNKVTKTSPIRLKTRIGLTKEALKNSKTGDAFYTNNFSDYKTTAVYTPAKDNKYYYKNIEYNNDGSIKESVPKYQNETVTKKENTTSTSKTSLETIFDEGVITATLGNNGKITVTKVEEFIDKTVQKIWKDNNDQEQSRPDSIEVELLANGEVIQTANITEKNNWTYTFASLPKNSTGIDILYTVREKRQIAGYQTTYSDDTFTITNNYKILSIFKNVDKATANTNDILTYAITISNDGDATLKDIKVTDVLDSHLEYVQSDGNYDEETRTITYTIPLIKPEEKISFTICAEVKKDTLNNTNILNTAVIKGTTENEKDIYSNEVTTLIIEEKEEIENPSTSDNINIVYITVLANVGLLGGYLLRRKFI